MRGTLFSFACFEGTIGDSRSLAKMTSDISTVASSFEEYLIFHLRYPGISLKDCLLGTLSGMTGCVWLVGRLIPAV
jgi:hypothetical protein